VGWCCTDCILGQLEIPPPTHPLHYMYLISLILVQYDCIAHVLLSDLRKPQGNTCSFPNTETWQNTTFHTPTYHPSPPSVACALTPLLVPIKTRENKGPPVAVPKIPTAEGLDGENCPMCPGKLDDKGRCTQCSTSFFPVPIRRDYLQLRGHSARPFTWNATIAHRTGSWQPDPIAPHSVEVQSSNRRG
jgi:hypothetical protein